MNVTGRRLRQVLSAILLASIPLGAAAAESEGARRIEEVIVTAERKEASVQDTSISITAFTAEFLDDFGIRNQEDLQNFVPATTIQPYDATVRGVGRNFRALGGDPGVSTYMNGVYSEDLLTATAATFWDVERIEVLRGPQGTLYGRNAVGGAINVLYKEPTEEFEAAVKGIVGNLDTREAYVMLSGPLIENQLSGRVNYAFRDRDGTIEEIGRRGDDLDTLGTENVALVLKWTPTDTLEFNIRHNWMDIDRVFGGANGGGLVVLNEEGNNQRTTDALVPGYRAVDTTNTNTANVFQSNFHDVSQPLLNFTNPTTGAPVVAQRVRPGIDFGDFDGFQNAAASLDGFNVTSPTSAARYNKCVSPGDIEGADVCGATNGFNTEQFEQEGTQFNVAWDVTDTLQLKYIYGNNDLTYERITDDDNTASQFHDRQFYVNHEAGYESHELQAFYEFGDNLSFTSGIFFYDAIIHQRGDFYSSVGEDRIRLAYQDNTALSAGAAALIGAPGLAGISASTLAFAGRPMTTLFSAKRSCDVANPAPSCSRNFAVKNTNEALAAASAGRNDNLRTSAWFGDNGSNPLLDVVHGPNTAATDLLYATKTEREAFAAYTQGVWDINEKFTLTLGLRYAEDDLTAEENLFRYSETGGGAGGFLGLFGGLAQVNIANGGIVQDGSGNWVPTPKATNGGIPFALSVFRPYERTDDKFTWRANLDWQVNDNAMMYFSATTGHRSGGYNLVFFSTTPTYDPEELIAYEIGYKTQWFDDTLQVNGSFYFYDYETIHTVATEVTDLGGLSTSVLEAPGAEIYGIEAETTWLATDRVTLGGNFSFTPSEYTEDLFIKDETGVNTPSSLFPDAPSQLQNINGNQLLQVPEFKATAWSSYSFPLAGGSSVELFATYSYIDEVYYSPFESNTERAEAYDRVDLRATFTSGNGSWIVTGFVNNVLDDVGVIQVEREGESEFFRHTATTTVPRLYGVEFTYAMGGR